jgi:hypothetical protein
MTLTDFIGEVIVGDKKVTILYVGIEDGYVMFGYYSNKKLITINSNRVIVNVQYFNRPALHGETYFIGAETITARWRDTEGKLFGKGKTKVRDASLTDVSIIP